MLETDEPLDFAPRLVEAHARADAPVAQNVGVSQSPAIDLLNRSGTKFRLHEYRHNQAATSYGQEAAAALGVEAGRVFKTLVTTADGRHVVAVVSVAAELDLKAMAQAVGAKRVAMADPTVAQRVTGYVLGGISPLGQKRPLTTVVDESAAAWETVFVSGGRRGLEIELSPVALVTLTSGQLAPIARVRQSG